MLHFSTTPKKASPKLGDALYIYLPFCPIADETDSECVFLFCKELKVIKHCWALGSKRLQQGYLVYSKDRYFLLSEDDFDNVFNKHEPKDGLSEEIDRIATEYARSEAFELEHKILKQIKRETINDIIESLSSCNKED